MPLFSFYTNIDEKIITALETDKSDDLEWSIMKAWEKGKIDSTMATNFTKLMRSLSTNPSIIFSRMINLKETFGIDSILDVAGGSGCYRLAPSMKNSFFLFKVYFSSSSSFFF
jgi:hypothetical protein